MAYKDLEKKRKKYEEWWQKTKSDPEKLAKRYARSREWNAKNPDYRSTYYANNKEKELKINAEWEKNNYVARVNIRLKQVYGITVDDYAEMTANQEGCCAICGYCSLELNKALCVDHDHETNKIRGLLCGWCNSMLGFARDNSKVLKKAIAYLKKHR